MANEPYSFLLEYLLRVARATIGFYSLEAEPGNSVANTVLSLLINLVTILNAAVVTVSALVFNSAAVKV